MYRRHAERIAAVWLQRMRESPPNKKLVLIYLANGKLQIDYPNPETPAS